MARMSFDTYQEAAPVLNHRERDGVKMFSLKDDGDEAVVRIMHDSTADFDIGTCHKLKIGDRFRKVACIRDPREPVDNCPLCKSGARLEQRIFIHMLRYEKGEDGRVTAVPVVWERAAKEYANKLKNMIQEYGPLSDAIFKVRRNGKSGDMSTTYELLFANPNVYRPDLYPKDTEAFKDYSAFGTVVMEKSFEEIAEFVATGQFPQRQNTRNEGTTNNEYRQSTPVNEQVTPNNSYVTQQPYTPNTAPAQFDSPTTDNRPPWETPSTTPSVNETTTSRPTRYY